MPVLAPVMSTALPLRSSMRVMRACYRASDHVRRDDAPLAHQEGVRDDLEGPDVHVRGAALTETREALVEPRVFAGHALLKRHGSAIDVEPGPATRQPQGAGPGAQLDVPALFAFLAKIEFRVDGDAFSGAQEQAGSDRRLLVLREFQRGALYAQFAGQHLREHGKRVDARIEDAEAPGLPDPALAGMPEVHVFLPVDPPSSQRARAHPFAGRVHTGRKS